MPHVGASIDHHQLNDVVRYDRLLWGSLTEQWRDFFAATPIDVLLGSDCLFDNEGERAHAHQWRVDVQPNQNIGTTSLPRWQSFLIFNRNRALANC